MIIGYCWNVGHTISSLLEAVLKVFPLDTYVDFPVCHSYGIYFFVLFFIYHNALIVIFQNASKYQDISSSFNMLINCW